MAAVYSESHTSLPSETKKVSSDDKKHSSREIGADLENCREDFSVENCAVEEAEIASSLAPEAPEHAGVAAWSAADPPIRIKEEPLEDSEYLTVHVDEDTEENWDHQGGARLNSGERADDNLPFCCEEINSVFGNKKHRREHTHDGPIVCLDTDTQWDNLLVSTDGGHQTLCCALCGCKFSNSREFFTHQLKHRNDLIKQETGEGLSKHKVFECNDCGKTYSSIGQCLNHQRSHKQASKSVFHQLALLKKKSFQCPTCGRSYSRASALDAHRRCHEEKLFKSKNSELEKYPAEEVAIKHEEAADTSSEQLDESPKKCFECVDCGKSFRTMGGLGTHQRFSVNCSSTVLKVRAKRSFECTECGKTFHRPMAMACHQRWHKRREQYHGNEQPFQCKECGRAFTSLTFYNKHQRLAHTIEMPAKSFLNQVVQLQKKAFECQECGRRFSRASALQSHQLCHTDIFSDIIEVSSQKASVEQTMVAYQNNQEKTAVYAESPVFSQNSMQTNNVVKELKHDGSFNTESSKAKLNYTAVILEDSVNHRCNRGSQQISDLELVCESDQEKKGLNRNSCDETEISFHKADLQVDVNSVKLDHVNLDGRLKTEKIEQSHSQDPKRYECSDCNRTFDKAGSLRCHMLWHRGGIGKKSNCHRNIHTANPIRKALIKCEICGHESFTKASHQVHLGKHEDRKPYKSMTYQLANLQKNSLKCDICGMHFSRLSALQSHQQRHNNVKKPYECLQCDKRYTNVSTLHKHQRTCNGEKTQNDKEIKTEMFNPSKTLLGPKVHHCKKCGKGFWSIGAFIHHKQYHLQCADINNRNSEAEDGHVRRKRRGRKRGMMTRHNLKPPALPDRIKSKLYKCYICDKSYRVIGCFLKHLLIHQSHEIQPPIKSFDYQVKQLKKNMYSCTDCGKHFSRAMALQFHMRSHSYETGLTPKTTTLYNQSEGLQCPNCNGVFNCEISLGIHQKHCSKAKKENIEKCQKVELNKLSAPKEDEYVQKQPCEDEKDSVTSDMKYTCDECDRSFSVVGALNFHKRIHRKSPNSMSESVNVSPSKPKEATAGTLFYCTECGRRFSTNSALGTHRRWHKDKKLARFLLKSSKVSRKNMENGPFLCNLCGKGFFYLCVLRRHQKYHPPIKTRSVPKLNLKPSELGNFSLKSSLDCPDCDEVFVSGSLLAAHFASYHAQPPKPETKQQMLESHLSVPVSDQAAIPIASLPTAVTITGETNKQKLKNHCHQCQRKFSNTRALRAHLWQKHKGSKVETPAKVNSSLKPLFCSLCGKRYVSHGALQNHLRLCDANSEILKQLPHKPDIVEDIQSPQHRPSDSGSKCLFKCHKCGKAFFSEKQLDAHKELARTRPHCCALCCRSYWTESQLQQHLIWHDEIRRRLPAELHYRLNSSASKVQDPGTNSVCPAKLFSTAITLQENRNYNCHQCCGMFLSQAALEEHQILHKGKKPYHCSLCPLTFAKLKDLVDHHQGCLGDKELRATPSPASSQDTESLTCIECGISFSQETDLHQHYIDHARGEF